MEVGREIWDLTFLGRGSKIAIGVDFRRHLLGEHFEMPNVACPKCQTKYKLPESMLGKVVQCPKCGARFKLPAPAAASVATAPRQPALDPATAMEMEKYGLDGPIAQQSNDIFGGTPAPQAQGANDPLGNFALDPGFNSPIQQDEEDTTGDADFFHNPALAPKKKKKKFEYTPQRTKLGNYDDEPFTLSEAIKEPWFIVLLIVFPLILTGMLVPYFGGDHLMWVQMVCLGIVGLISAAINVWMLVEIYKNSQSVGTLLASMFIPFYILYYIFTNWAVMKRSVNCQIVCCVMCFLMGIFTALTADNFA